MLAFTFGAASEPINPVDVQEGATRCLRLLELLQTPQDSTGTHLAGAGTALGHAVVKGPNIVEDCGRCVSACGQPPAAAMQSRAGMQCVNRHALAVTSPTIGAQMYVCTYILCLYTHTCAGAGEPTHTVCDALATIACLGTTALSLSPSEFCCRWSDLCCCRCFVELLFYSPGSVQDLAKLCAHSRGGHMSHTQADALSVVLEAMHAVSGVIPTHTLCQDGVCHQLHPPGTTYHDRCTVTAWPFILTCLPPIVQCTCLYIHPKLEKNPPGPRCAHCAGHAPARQSLGESAPRGATVFGANTSLSKPQLNEKPVCATMQSTQALPNASWPVPAGARAVVGSRGMGQGSVSGHTVVTGGFGVRGGGG